MAGDISMSPELNQELIKAVKYLEGLKIIRKEKRA